jgi:pimeloyl-ACP methyl ester carboxylesterase
MNLRTVLVVLLFSLAGLAQISTAQTTPANASHGFAPVDGGGKLYYEVAGQGHALVLIHGGQLDRRMWDDQFQFFAKNYKVIRYDVRGFGSSPAATQPFSSKEDLAELLKYLKVDKAYILGLSLGGRIAIDFAVAHPDMTDGLILAAPGLSGFNLSDPSELKILAAAQNGDVDKATDLWLQSGYMAPAMKIQNIAPRIRELSKDNFKQNLDNFAFQKDIFAQSVDHLAEIKTNTLIIVGSLDVKGIHEIAGLLRARIPNSTDTVIQGAGHMLNMERPQEFNSIVLGFLEKQPPIKMEPR